MHFPTIQQARAHARSEAAQIPALRGRLRVVRGTFTQWDRCTGEPTFGVPCWTVVMK